MFEQEFGSQTMAQVVMQKSCFSGQRIDKPWFLNYNKDLIKNDVDGEDVKLSSITILKGEDRSIVSTII
jgi:hypothetical protein